MQPWSRDYAGRFDEHELESDALRGNRLGDPHVRPLWVYTPPVYALEPDRCFPSVYLIQGLTGQLDMWRNRSAFRPNVLELVDALFADEACPPALVVFVDAWTSYGGSQFLDSPGVGNYHTYLCDEIVPFVDGRYRTLAEAAHRGITGKSSGGYGAMGTPMLRPDLFGALGSHATRSAWSTNMPTRSAACARSTSTPGTTTSSSSTSAPRASSAHSSGSASPRSSSSSSTGRTAASSTGTRSHCAISPSGSRRDRSRAPPGEGCHRARGFPRPARAPGRGTRPSSSTCGSPCTAA